MSRLTPLSPASLAERIAQGSIQIIDIREADEYAREHIAASQSLPLSSLNQALPNEGKDIVFTCKSGQRTKANSEHLAACAPVPAYVLEGGLDGWKRAGFASVIIRSKPIDMMRQVQMIAGSLILLGVVLGTLVHPGLYGISAFVGAGPLFAGLTGFCGMARLLAFAPWNRQSR